MGEWNRHYISILVIARYWAISYYIRILNIPLRRRLPLGRVAKYNAAIAIPIPIIANAIAGPALPLHAPPVARLQGTIASIEITQPIKFSISMKKCVVAKAVKIESEVRVSIIAIKWFAILVTDEVPVIVSTKFSTRESITFKI